MVETNGGLHKAASFEEGIDSEPYKRKFLINDHEVDRDPDNLDRRLTYPKAVIFVLISKFFESFAANGVRTVMALYLHDSLKFSESSATVYFHVFNFFSQFCPIFGAIIADSYIGNVKTIFYSFILYSFGWIGTVILTLPLKNVPIASFIIASLVLIAIGNGNIRACVTTLGGSQFDIPAQSMELHRYFSHYYFMYTLGILLSKIIPPEIRVRTHCFGENECYTAVYGFLGFMFLTAWIIFLLGMFFYKNEEVTRDARGNILFQVCGCIYTGTKYKFKSLRQHKWIDGLRGYYSDCFIQDVCDMLKVLKLFIPLPMYWALFTQVDSSWTFQSSQLDRFIFGYELKTDEVKGIGPLMLLLLIPFWEKLIVPLLRICNLEISPLTSIIMGGSSAAVSFFCAATLQFYIENSLEKISIYWQFPQFIFLMLGEVWLSIPGLNFSFTQSPPTMKSVMTAAWFCNNAFGNLIVILITQLRLIDLQVSGEFFLYATLMTIAMIIFWRLARNYHYSAYEQISGDNQNTVQRRSSSTSSMI